MGQSAAEKTRGSPGRHYYKRLRLHRARAVFLPEVTDLRPWRETVTNSRNSGEFHGQPRAPRAAPSRPGQRLATPRRHGVHQWRGAELQRPAASGGSRQAQSIRECFSGAAPGFRSAALSGQHGPIACLGRLLLPNVARARLVAS